VVGLGGKDPYRLDCPSGHRDGAWLGAQWEALGRPRLHIRGLHYALASQATIIKPEPNATLYRNTDEDWEWISDRPARAARWLGYIPFNAIPDQRADEPLIFRPALTAPEAVIERGLGLEGFDPLPTVQLRGFNPRQTYAFCIFGEKSSLSNEIEPVAAAHQADLYLGAGELSNTHIYDLASRAAADGRPLLAVTLTDLDPGGYQMAVSIARKLRALRTSELPGLEYRIIEAGLTLDQARDLDLPSTPLKPGEKRADRWKAAWGWEQTELDAALALRPGVLAAATEEALAPYFDSALADSTEMAARNWTLSAQRQLQRSIGNARWRALGARWAELRAAIEVFNAELAQAVEPVRMPPPPLPAATPRGTEAANVVASSEWSFVEETAALKARKAYGDDP
jgi:hypothetical protein